MTAAARLSLLRSLPALVLLGGLAACSLNRPADPPPPSSPPPVARPAKPPQATGKNQSDIREARARAARAANRTAAKAAAVQSDLAEYYRNMERDLIARGKMRTERAPADAPIDAATLARNFVRIALRNEYDGAGRRVSANGTPAPLRRWDDPVHIQLEFGAATDLASRTRDRAAIAGLAARLERAAGHPVGMTLSGGNFIVLVLTEDERRDEIGPRLRALVPGIPDGDIAAIRGLAPQNLCTVFAYSQGARSDYVRAVALIRAELPSRLRTSCIHEELAQGLGLANDSPAARPSIFNDDEEFALLTRHDELLLEMLYDPRLYPGMTEAEARPVVDQIAAGLMGAN